MSTCTKVLEARRREHFSATVVSSSVRLALPAHGPLRNALLVAQRENLVAFLDLTGNQRFGAVVFHL